MSHSPSLSFGPEWMRPKPTHSNSSLSLHSSTQSPFTATIGSSSMTTMSSKPKLPKHPTWSGESSARHVSSAVIPTTPTTSGATAASFVESQPFHQDDSGPEPLSPTFGATATTVDPPMIAHNENGRRYSRQELLDVWSQMKASGLLNKSSPANFPPLPTVGTEAAKARSRLGTIGGGTAREGSMEYEKFIARTLVPPELYPDTGLSETDSQKSPSPPAQIRLSFKELHGESETRSSSPFVHMPLLPASIGISSNGLRSTSAHFPIPALDNIPRSTSSPSLQNQPLAESILPPLTNLSLSLPDFAAPFSQSASSTWSPFSGTPTSQHAQLQPQMQHLDQDPFMPSIVGAANDQFSPIPVHHQAFPQQQQFPPPPPPPPPGLSLPPILVPAPLIQWVYLDNSGAMQGPFPGPMMHEWYVNQWLTPDLKIRRVEENEYYTLAEFQGLVGNDIDPFMVPLPRFDLDMQQPFQQQQQQQETILGKSQAGQKDNKDEVAQPALDKPVPEEEENLTAVPEPIATPVAKSKPTARLELEPESETMPRQEIAVKPTLEPSPAPEPVDEPEEPATQQQTGWDVPAVVDNSWGVPEVDNSWATAPAAPSPSKPSTTTGASGKHKLQPLPPAPTLLTKLGGESVSPAATPSPTAHTSVPIAPWAKNATEKKTKTLSLKEIEEREARTKKLQEQRLQQQQQQELLLLQRKAAEIDLTNGNVITDDLSGSSGSIPPGLPRTSTWAKAVNSPSVKKTLAQIQKEEEEARQRKATTAAAANSNTMPGVMTAQGRKYAEIMSTKPTTPVGLSRTATASVNSSSGDAWTTIGPGGKKAGTTTSATGTTSTANIRRTVSTPVSTVTVARKTAVVKPSVSTDEFFKWCRLTLKGVNSGVNAEELLTMLLSLPLAGPETVEIIADTVYANSTMMDGRRFAEEFVKRRKAVEGSTDTLVALAHASGDGAGKLKTDDKSVEGWNEVLVKGNAKALKTASTPSGANEGWNSAFKVIGTKKKGKR
ncbi:hypothetical protein V1517DRAFT_325843 [Lipomyces orientalis]|uniref:Uncharacterized protein n=1 Tax=Lipomyces orientalis TaxID=1233043 RepID=A0ACC3TL39_9ASCO